MAPEIATILFAIGVLGLVALDRERTSRTANALWVPVIWVSIGASRMVSQWLGVASQIVSADQALEGNPLDQIILGGLMAAGVMVLLRRGREVRTLLRANAPILVFFTYCAASVLWSDYPDVAFKRWIKAMGDLEMVLIVLTDPYRAAAVRRFLARLGFLLVPASVLLIKYYPGLGILYGHWTGNARYIGVGLSKNMLGLICLITGLGCVWRYIEAIRGREGARKVGPLIAQTVLLVMVVWLFGKTQSMTSLATFALATGVMAATSFPTLTRKRAVAHLAVASTLCFALATLFLEGGAGLLGTVGKDPTITGRTELWNLLLNINQHPIVGYGFESFWSGKQLEEIWRIIWWHPNEAHNGYLEVFLNLGWTGVALLAVVIVTGYRNIVSAFSLDAETGSLGLALFVVGLVFGLTEAAFRLMSPVWFVFLLAIIESTATVTSHQMIKKDSHRIGRWSSSSVISSL